jgi:uncharacterized damage-inducible protein DinB
MMDKNTLTALYDYTCWANSRLLDALRQAGEAAFTAPNPALYHGSLRGVLTHMLSAEWIWRMRLQEGISPTTLVDAQDFSNIEALADRWAQEQAAMRGYLESLSDADLQRVARYRSTKGVAYENVVWHVLTHVVNHSTQHRSEAAMVLTQLGSSPGDLDLIVYFRM